jgi:hypothetical protein
LEELKEKGRFGQSPVVQVKDLLESRRSYAESTGWMLVSTNTTTHAVTIQADKRMNPNLCRILAATYTIMI